MARLTARQELEKATLTSKLDKAKIQYLAFSYVIIIGFLNVVFLFFQDVSLQTPILILFYAFLIWLYYTVLKLGAPGIQIITRGPFIVLFTILFALLVWTAAVGGEVIPEIFTIILP